MQFKKLQLFTTRLKDQKAFFVERLGLPLIREHEEGFTVRVGWTELEWTESEHEHVYHYCFLLPTGSFEKAMAWMGERVALVELATGDYVQPFPDWNAHSFYFMDGDGNIAECIERHDLVLEGSGAFGPEGLLCVNEMGLPTTDIGATGERLNAALGTEFWRGNLNRFGTVGTQEGLFLLPNPNQKATWYPTEVEITRGDFVAEVEHEGRTGTVQVVDGQLTIL